MRLYKLFLVTVFILLAIGVSCLLGDGVLATQAECVSNRGECCCGCGPCSCTVCYSGVGLGIPLGHFGFSILLSGLVILCLLSYTMALKQMGWKRPDFKKLIAFMTLSGGSVYVDHSSYKYCVRYYGKDIILHNIFCDLVRHAYGFRANPAKCEVRGSFLTQIYRKALIQDLLSFSPSYSTRNNGGNDDHRPRGTFLLDSRHEVIREAVRLASSANSCLRYEVEHRYNNHDECFFIRPQFCFGYLSGPTLLEDYRQILKRVEIETFPILDDRFMRGFLMSKSWRTVENLAKMNGFIDGVKINFGNHKGLERNNLLYALLSFYIKEENRFKAKEDATEKLQKYLARAG